jgi:hypothetical protein
MTKQSDSLSDRILTVCCWIVAVPVLFYVLVLGSAAVSGLIASCRVPW